MLCAFECIRSKKFIFRHILLIGKFPHTFEQHHNFILGYLYFSKMESINSSYFSDNSPESYNLFTHNCNNFSEEIAQFLCGASIPKYILELPNEVLNSVLGPALTVLGQQLEKSARPIDQEQSDGHLFRRREPSPGLEQLASEVEEARSENGE